MVSREVDETTNPKPENLQLCFLGLNHYRCIRSPAFLLVLFPPNLPRLHSTTLPTLHKVQIPAFIVVLRKNKTKSEKQATERAAGADSEEQELATSHGNHLTDELASMKRQLREISQLAWPRCVGSLCQCYHVNRHCHRRCCFSKPHLVP